MYFLPINVRISEKHGLEPNRLRAEARIDFSNVAMTERKEPWSNRPVFDDIGAAVVSGLFTDRRSPTDRSSRQLVPADHVVGWLGTTGISLLTAACNRRRQLWVVVSLTRTVVGCSR